MIFEVEDAEPRSAYPMQLDTKIRNLQLREGEFW